MAKDQRNKRNTAGSRLMALTAIIALVAMVGRLIGEARAFRPASSQTALAKNHETNIQDRTLVNKLTYTVRGPKRGDR